MNDTAEEELSEEMIKHLHYILKHDTKDSALSWVAIGEYKRRGNLACGKETAKPKDVLGRLRSLLSEYNEKAAVTIDDIIPFIIEDSQKHFYYRGLSEWRKTG